MMARTSSVVGMSTPTSKRRFWRFSTWWRFDFARDSSCTAFRITSL
jgi:hypothetical protein